MNHCFVPFAHFAFPNMCHSRVINNFLCSVLVYKIMTKVEYFSFSAIMFTVEHINQSKITFVFVFSLFM